MTVLPRSRLPQLAVLLLSAVAVLPACSAVAIPMPDLAEEINSTLRLDPFVIREGDVLDVRFFRKSEWNFITRVRQDGRGSFTGLNELPVAGLTIAQLHELLNSKYSTMPEQPEVTVEFATAAEDSALNPRGVTVIGEVVNPGPILLRGERITILDALARAGGPDKRTANLRNTLLVRWLPDQKRRVAWRFDASIEYWGSPVPVYLQPNDIVFVPNTSIDDVDIWVDQYIRLMLPFGIAIPVPV